MGCLSKSLDGAIPFMPYRSERSLTDDVIMDWPFSNHAFFDLMLSETVHVLLVSPVWASSSESSTLMVKPPFLSVATVGLSVETSSRSSSGRSCTYSLSQLVSRGV